MVEQLLQTFGDMVRLNPENDVDDLLDAFLAAQYQKGSQFNPWTDKDNPPRSNVSDSKHLKKVTGLSRGMRG